MTKILFLFNAPAMKLRQNLIDAFAQKGFDCVVALPKTDIALGKRDIHGFTFCH